MATSTNSATPTTEAPSEVVKPEAIWNDEQLGNVKTFADAMALLNEASIETVSTEDLGNGFAVLDDKDRLLKVPFVILDARLNNGDHGEFVSLYVVTERNEKFIVNDGSTGIRDQIKAYATRLGRPPRGIAVKGGLSRSDYVYKDATTGEDKGAKTYYLV